MPVWSRQVGLFLSIETTNIMANEIRIDLDPEGPITFQRPINIPTPSGEAMPVVFTFIHRDSDQMAVLQEEWVEHGRAVLKTEVAEKKARESARKVRIDGGEDADLVILDEPMRLKDMTRQKREHDADAVMAVATDWSLKSPAGTKYEFTRENLVKFLKRYQGAALTIITDYRIGMSEGRLGNSEK